METVVLIILLILGVPVGVVLYLSRRISRVEAQTQRALDRLLTLEGQLKGVAAWGGSQSLSPSAEPMPPQTPAEAPPAVVDLPGAARPSRGIAERLSDARADRDGTGASERMAATVQRPRLRPAINWENFMGVKLFAWLGGLALFLATAFFIKYSFENDWISPQLRIVLGFLTGVGLIAGGLRLPMSRSPITVQTLCATGVLVLYADIFAAHAFYGIIASSLLTFLLMALVTAAAFLLAVRLDAQVVAVLGLIGGFLTPPLLATGVDNALGLFGYLAILDVGLAAVALRKKWPHLVLLAALATVFMQIGWVVKFFVVGKIWVALAVFFGFTLLFAVALGLAHRLQRAEKWTEAAAALMPLVSLAFVFYLLERPYPELAARPGLIFSFVFLVDLALLGLVCLRENLRRVQVLAGGAVFLLLTAWTWQFLTEPLLNWALACYLVFSGLHAVFPVVLQRWRPAATPLWWGYPVPAVALLLVMVLITRHSGVLPLLVWPYVLLIDLLAVGLAVFTASILAILPVLVMTLLAIALWIEQAPAAATGLAAMLVVVGGFALVFFCVGIFAVGKIPAGAADSRPEAPGQRIEPALSGWISQVTGPMVQIPALAAALPFLLLVMVILRLPLPNPSPVFALGVLLAVLLLGVVRTYRGDLLMAVALGCVLLVEHVWHVHHFDPVRGLVPLCWYLGFAALFLVFPFVFAKHLENRILPWAVAALSGPAHFFLVYRLISQAYPNPYPGLVPAAFALPTLAGLVWLLRRVAAESPIRNALLALFGGSSLFFISLIFPIQFERQWITIGWALEGAALLWLFHRVPHPGLQVVGVGLLAAAFVRLALNPAVFAYHPRSGWPIVNWTLYTYGITTACLFTGARLLAPTLRLPGNVRVRGLLYGLGTILAFVLLNIEIADYFSTGATLTFHFSGNLAQDMTYSLAWAAFAFILFILGIQRNIVPARYAGLGLLTVTLLKLFLHDLWRLGGLYRIGSLIGLAVVLILVSFIYQRGGNR